jgi:hypothetical protein
MAWAEVLDLRVIGDSVQNGESKPAAFATCFKSLQAPYYHPVYLLHLQMAFLRGKIGPS